MLPAITGDANLVFLWVVCVELGRLHQTETGLFRPFDSDSRIVDDMLLAPYPSLTPRRWCLPIAAGVIDATSASRSMCHCRVMTWKYIRLRGEAALVREDDEYRVR
jgi:hypothetical protein